MTTYALNKVIRASSSFSTPNGDEAIVVLHFASPAVCTQLEVNGAASAIEQLWTTAIAGVKFAQWFCSGTTLVSCTARTVDPANPIEKTEVFGLPGLGGPTTAPAESAFITTFYTDLPTRRGRGRAFWPAFDGGGVVDGGWPVAARNDIQAEMVAWQAAIPGSDGIEQVVWSKLNNTARTVGDYLVRGYLGHQRRRRS